MGPAGLGGGPPAGPAVGRQGGPLVGPVVRGDRRRLGDDHARTAAGPPGVVGDVAVPDGAAAPQVGGVGPEHHPRGGEMAPDDDGFGEHGGRHYREAVSMSGAGGALGRVLRASINSRSRA